LPAAHLDEQADDAAHHLLAEGGGLDVEAQHPVTEVVPRASSTRLVIGRSTPERHLRLPAERREVVLAEQRVAARRSAARSSGRDVPAVAARNGSGTGPVEDRVAVPPGDARVPGVEVAVDDRRLPHHDGRPSRWFAARCRATRSTSAGRRS
jgi:hypothetical protein